jgi:hypothetical protein
VTGPTLPPVDPTWADALDARLLRRLLGRRPRLSPAARRGLDRLALGERRVPVSLRLARRAHVAEEEPAGPALTVVHAIGRAAADAGRAADIVRQPARRADEYPRSARPEAGPVRQEDGDASTAVGGRRQSAPGPEPEPMRTARPSWAPGQGRLRVVPAVKAGEGAAGPVVASMRATGAPVARRGTAGRDGYPGTGTRGRAVGASAPVSAVAGALPARPGSPVSPAPAPRVRPAPRDPARTGRPQVPASRRGARSSSVAPRAVVQPRAPSAPGPTRPAHPRASSAPPSRAGEPPAGGPPAATPPARAASGGAVQPLRAAATEPVSEAARSTVDDVVEQVLRRLGREFAVSAERRGLRGGERGGELGR